MIKLPVFLFLLAVLPAITVQSQVKWKNVNGRFGDLPRGIEVFESDSVFKGRPFKAFMARVDLDNRKIKISTDTSRGRRLKPAEYYSQNNHPEIVVNGSFFSFQTNRNLNVVMNNGRVLAYNITALKRKQTDSFLYTTRSAIGFTKKKKADIAWIFTDSGRRYPYAFQNSPVFTRGTKPVPTLGDLRTLEPSGSWKMKTAIGGGPVLVMKGEKRITNKEEQMFLNGDADLHPRTAMGITRDNQLIILMVEGRNPGIASGASLEDMAEIFLDLKCVEALNLDGGGSSCMLINGEETIKVSDKTGQRPVPAVLMIDHTGSSPE